MNNQHFYTQDIQGETAFFSPEESNHITKTLRKKENDIIRFTDGAGGLYEGVITTANAGRTEVRLTKRHNGTVNTPPPMHIVVAPTKNMDRIEWFVEKAVEVGVTEISFIVTKNSERKILKTDRLKKIAISAMKQSNQLFLPKINEIISLKEFLEKVREVDCDKFFGYCAGDFYSTTKIDIETGEITTEKLGEPFFYSEAINEDIPVIMLIGPEGDFTPEEAQICVENNFLPSVLTNTRLRTETAALMACWTYAEKRLTGMSIGDMLLEMGRDDEG
ncbi:MAG: 16S rRNA (uracil(1498)-N(3))-methyltransferase [Bacteroidales bacterium]|jgi:16S rRNA (uracil1498-N3)-methyltransferase|nr:16S rRNA (uracil(1498)-N(3))-methyltransferase [Bacteroidales bacterium]